MDRIIPSIFNRQGCNYTIERVRFGVDLDQICGTHDDIPAPLLILILKLNKQAPYKKDVFRAPGHQGNMKKLIHFLQTGHLVNIENFSVHTIASVLKKFLRKLPNGLFGSECEKSLFDIVVDDNNQIVETRLNKINQLILSLPDVTQHLLVLLFGTFKAIATTSERVNTGMTSEALGVSVAPSFFRTCVQDGSEIAKMVDVQRYKKATQITKFLIDHFGSSDLFGRENYLYYARISGRVLKIENRYIHWSPTLTSALTTARLQQLYKQQQCYSSPYKWKQHMPQTKSSSNSRSRNIDKDNSTTSPSPSIGSAIENAIIDGPALENSSRTNFINKTPSRSTTSGTVADDVIADSKTDLEPFAGRHSLILVDSQNVREGEPLVLSAMRRPTLLTKARQSSQNAEGEDSSSDMFHELREANQYAESTKSLTFLPKVHERQAERMKTRSEWFLNPHQLQHQKLLNMDTNTNHSQRQRNDQQQLELQLKLQLNLERQQEQLNQILQVISSSPMDSPSSVTNRTAIANQCRPVTFSSL